MKAIMQIAVILTCHNRKNSTIQCIKTLLEAVEKAQGAYALSFFVCEDKCTDGTVEAIKDLSDQMHIISGSGDLFWPGGMVAALREAEKFDADFYLMVCDDVIFWPNVFDVMINSYNSIPGEMHIIVGSTIDKETGEHTYGGRLWDGRGLGGVIKVVLPQNPCAECNQLEWNCLLMPKKLYEQVGEIDTYYDHGWADYDYGYRAAKCGYKMYVATDYIGYCSRNSLTGTWEDTNLSMIKRLKALHTKKGLPPKSHWYFCKKYYGKEALVMFIRPYLHIIKSSIIQK